MRNNIPNTIVIANFHHLKGIFFQSTEKRTVQPPRWFTINSLEDIDYLKKSFQDEFDLDCELKEIEEKIIEHAKSIDLTALKGSSEKSIIDLNHLEILPKSLMAGD